MYEYLISFLKENLILLLLGFLFVTVASLYYKKVRRCALFLLGAGIIYFLLVVLYKNGIGIEALYVLSTKYIKMGCTILSKATDILLTEHFFVSKLILFVLRHNIEEFITFMLFICYAVLFVVFLMGIMIPSLKIRKKNNLPNHFTRVIKCLPLSNTNKETQPLFLLNAVLRI